MSPQESIAAQALPGLNVLIVDNNAVNRGILSEMISNWRMNPTAADNGAVALDLLEAAQIAGHPFPIVLLDAMMPELDGFEVLRRIQPKHGLPEAIVMLLSGNHRLADSEQCRQLGLKHSLMKPVGQSELLDAILAALGLAAAEKQFIGPILSTPERPLGKSLHILLAEDNPVNQKLAIRLLEKAGHRVDLACTGREALEAWENSGTARFDVVLMDIQMPEMDGLEAAAGIRNREQGSGNRVPILAMTAHAMRGDKEKCLASGMDGYVSKPIRPAELFAEIDKWVKAPQGSDTVQDTSLQNNRNLPEQIDRLSLFERVEGDHELIAEMVHLFQEEAPHLLAVMRDALQSGDMLVLERAAHSLKGAAANLSAQATVAAALQVEKAAASHDLNSTTENLGALERAVEHLLPALVELRQGVTK
jgi:CheY-like chemotaxis protein/HPt (histidine-containing phosphotransfer) domain-containing protein